MAKFEYKTIDFSTPACEGMGSKLNKLGKEGWELVSVCPTGSWLISAFLKREIQLK